MGQLECQAMPYLCEVAHDGVLCTFSNRSAPDRKRWFDPSGQAAWTGHHVQNHTLVTLLQQARWDAVLGQPSRLWPHWVDPQLAQLREICVRWVPIIEEGRAASKSPH